MSSCLLIHSVQLAPLQEIGDLDAGSSLCLQRSNLLFDCFLSLLLGQYRIHLFGLYRNGNRSYRRLRCFSLRLVHIEVQRDRLCLGLLIKGRILYNRLTVGRGPEDCLGLLRRGISARA